MINIINDFFVLKLNLGYILHLNFRFHIMFYEII
jgi:hypothetical protein